DASLNNTQAIFKNKYSGPQYLDQYLRSDLAQNIG
ncbi:hypothetical protein AZO1586I_2521, partial [Bathymodiolus thermophilus thioautotrophic gill symbiont]